MPLIECPDCGKQVSDAAPACVSCGRPLQQNASTAQRGTPEAPMVIEQSSKFWKGGMLVGVGVVLLGLLIAWLAPAGSGAGITVAFLLVAGVITFLFSMVLNWWGHG